MAPRSLSSLAARRRERHPVRARGQEEPLSSAARCGRHPPRVERFDPAREAGHRRRGRQLVGSFNLDPFSLAHPETLVEVADIQVVEQGMAWIQDHCASSRSMTSLEASTQMQRWLLDPLGVLLARLTDAISRVIASRRQRQATLDNPWSRRREHHALPAAAGQPGGSHRLRRPRPLSAPRRIIYLGLRSAPLRRHPRSSVLGLLGQS